MLKWVRGARRWGVSVLRLLAFGILLSGAAAAGVEADRETARLRELFLSIPWQDGPRTVPLGSVAQIELPAGFRFTGPEGARKLAEIRQDPPDENCLGVIVPAASLDWYLDFHYAPIGYVADAEKDRIDANAVLADCRTCTAQGNSYRRSKGWPELQIIGWEYPPKFDDSIKQLTWAIRAESAGQISVNYDVRMLGRGGVMQVRMVTDPAHLGASVPTAKGLLTGFQFTSGNKYGEWRAGDRVAEYGLTGLITGGIVAGAAKSGLLAKFGKLLAVAGKGIAALAAGVAAWLGKKFFSKASAQKGP